jgi:hypothetical protein
MFRRHGPILKTTTAAIAAYLVALLPTLDFLARRRLSPTGVALFFLLGVRYTQFFVYAAHRFAMHRGIPLLANVRRNHLEHHRVFHGPRVSNAKAGKLGAHPGSMVDLSSAARGTLFSGAAVPAARRGDGFSPGLGVAAIGLAAAAHGWWSRDRTRSAVLTPPPGLAKT